MKAAVLCNGPSRILYKNTGYDYIIGCNFPWTNVDSTVILDIQVVHKWLKDKMQPVPIWFSRHAWRECHHRDRNYFKDYFLGLVDQQKDFDSCGHVATRKVIELGYTDIDIYGCDSYFENKIDSYTHQYVANISPKLIKQMEGWRKRWDALVESNDHINITLIR